MGQCAPLTRPFFKHEPRKMIYKGDHRKGKYVGAFYFGQAKGENHTKIRPGVIKGLVFRKIMKALMKPGTVFHVRVDQLYNRANPKERFIWRITRMAQ